MGTLERVSLDWAHWNAFHGLGTLERVSWTGHIGTRFMDWAHWNVFHELRTTVLLPGKAEV